MPSTSGKTIRVHHKHHCCFEYSCQRGRNERTRARHGFNPTCHFSKRGAEISGQRLGLEEDTLSQGRARIIPERQPTFARISPHGMSWPALTASRKRRRGSSEV